MRRKNSISMAATVGTIVLMAGGIGRAQSSMMVATAWAPVDQAAERLFRQADSDKSGFLSPDQFKTIEPKLNKSISELARKGALRRLPPNALNAKSFGLMLPGAKQISCPEFVLEARSRASRLLAKQNPPIGMPGPFLPAIGMNGNHPHSKQHTNRSNGNPRNVNQNNGGAPRPRDTAAAFSGGNSV